MRVLLDTNIVVDVLQRREPWFQDGAVIFRAIANKQIEGCLTAKQITDLIRRPGICSRPVCVCDPSAEINRR